MDELMLHDLYVAAADPERWGRVLEQLPAAVGGARASFVALTKSAAPSDGLLVELSVTGTPSAPSCRCSRDHVTDKGTAPETSAPIGCLSVFHGVLGKGLDLRPGEFQFLWNDSVGHVAFGLVDDSPATSLYFVIERALEDGPFDQSDICRICSIGPHLQRALTLRRRFQELCLEHRLLTDVLDGAPYGVMAVTAGRSISWKNRTAETILRADDGLIVTNGILHATASGEDRRLRYLFRSLEDARTRPSSIGVRVSRPSGRRPYLVVASRPAPDASTVLALPDTAAILVVHDPEVVQAPSTARLIELFSLTPAEASLAASLIEGKKLDELAAERSVKLSTLRTQLRAVLAKTEVAGQTDLIRLLSPLPTL